MRGFAFSLADNTCLREGPGGYFLLSRLPLRVLRLNEPLFLILQQLREGDGLAELVRKNPGVKEGRLLWNLLFLTSRGYLKLEGVAEPEEYPRVSVIIPVRDQPEDLAECLKALSNLDYPADRLEIIAVDDGSRPEVSVDSAAVRVIRLDESQGASVCRNTGAGSARGDILAFLDADCIAGEGWLRETVPFFRTVNAGAVGAYVDGYYKDSCLDRYEEVSSSLNMGSRIIMEGKTASGFYVPTANMLVTKEAFTRAGGFRGGMHVGEDVDFCWRLRNLGYTLLYVPLGRVAHKHRNRPGKMLKRRAEYGTSEAVLYRGHRDKRKTFLVSVCAGLSFLALALSILLLSPYPLIAVPLLFGIGLFRKSAALKKFGMGLPLRQTAYAALRSQLSFYYFALFHLVRYYLVPIVGLGFLLHSVWYFGGLALLLTSIVDYHVKKPKLAYPVFLFFYALEHLAYQAGVFWGCLKQKYFGSYLLSFKRA